MSILDNWLDQDLDVAGSINQSATKLLIDESTAFGQALSGQTGAFMSIDTVVAGIATVSGLTGMTTASTGNFITVTGAVTSANNGTFLITEYVSATSVKYENLGAVAGDANNGSITWTERAPYSLQDDLNFVRTDRRLIKGTTNFYDGIPTYDRPTAVGTPIDANLTNIASKTLDAQAHTLSRKFENQTVAATDLVVTLLATGFLQHADAVDRTGVPIQDGADAANLDSCYVDIIDPTTGGGVVVDGRPSGQINTDSVGTAVIPADGEDFVLDDGVNAAVTFEFDTNASVSETATLRQVDTSAATNEDDVKNAIISSVNGAPALTISATDGGAGLVDLANSTPGTAGNVTITETVINTNFTVTGMTGGLATFGQRVYGFTQAGGATEPDEVEVKFYSITDGSPISTANAYTWEASLPTSVDMFYGYRDQMDQFSDAAFRTMIVNGVVSDAGLTTRMSNLQDIISESLTDTDTDLDGLLTNVTNFYMFSDLPNGTPSVVEALNTLNTQVGDRDYTGLVLTDGETITDSLQAIADATAAHELLDTLVHNLAETSFTENAYVVGKLVRTTVWTTAGMTIRVRESTFTYTGSKLTTSVTVPYDALGVAIPGATITNTFTYSGSTLISTTTVRS